MNYSSYDSNFIRIAFVGPVTSVAGKQMSQGIQLYFDSINEKGGISGKKLKLDLYDDQDDCGPNGQAEQSALKMVEDHKAIAVIGHWYSGCSIRGGKVYKKYGVPAITPGSVSVAVTKDNEWYFRNIFNNRISGQFLANYVKKVFRQNKVTIIRENDSYGAYLAEIFEETALGLGMEIKNVWKYDVVKPSTPEQERLENQKLEDNFKNMVSQLKKQREEAGTLFLAMQAPEAIRLVKMIKDATLNNIIIGETSLSEDTFKHGFDHLPKEKSNPGFYTNDIYGVTPLIFDTANEKGQQFKTDYEARHIGEIPDWSAAYAYDTAMVLVKAIREAKITGEFNSLAEDRQRVRDYLASMINIHDAVEGTTGFNYFDKNRDSQKPVAIGVYKNKNLVSALTQLQTIRNLNEIADLETAIKEEKVLKIDDNYMYKTNVVYVGIKINEITGFDPSKLTYQLDFHIWFRFQGGFNPQDIEFLNAVEAGELGLPVVDKMKDQITYRVYRINKREFKADFLNRYAYKQHIVGVNFRHRELTRNNLIYVTDILGMGLTRDKSLYEQLQESQIISPTSGWEVANAMLFQDITKKYSLGDPEFLNVQGGTVEYSRFNSAINIKKSEFTLRGLMSYNTAYNLFLVSVVVLLLLNITTTSKRFRRFSKTTWLLQTVFTFLLLLSSEIILVEWLAEKTNPYSLKSMIRIFDILWWMIPAFLLNLASESFIWTPLEEKSGRIIPNIVRLFLAFIIYFLAIIGIIAFVYEEQLTSILATSGVIAMIIGLAIQINISNIFSGIAINIERPFRIGDWVQIGKFDEGEIVDITWRTTRLKTRADCILSIPNSMASESPILNYCYPDETFWLWPTVYVHPMHHPERVKKILLDALLSTNQHVLKEPAPVIIFTGINEWAASYWVAFCAGNYANKFYILEEVWTRVWFHLNRAGITPAVQRQEIHWFRGVKERGGEEATKPTTLLQEVDIFKPFSDQAKQHLSENIRRHRYPPGEIIVRQGDQGDSLFIIVEGVVGVRVRSEETQSTEVARLGAGNIFGEMALLTGEKRTATVVSISETLVYEITNEDIKPLLQQQPEVTELISKMLTQRQLATQSRLNIHQAVEEEKEAVYKRFLNRIENFFGLTEADNNGKL